MNFIEAVQVCFKKYATFGGRARRSEYWWWCLFICLISIVAGILDAVVFGNPSTEQMGPLEIIINLVIFLPGLTVSVRRLHDIGKSGKWLFIMFTIIGIIPLIYWAAVKGDDGENQYGEDPLRFG